MGAQEAGSSAGDARRKTAAEISDIEGRLAFLSWLQREERSGNLAAATKSIAAASNAFIVYLESCGITQKDHGDLGAAAKIALEIKLWRMRLRPLKGRYWLQSFLPFVWRLAHAFLIALLGVAILAISTITLILIVNLVSAPWAIALEWLCVLLILLSVLCLILWQRRRLGRALDFVWRGAATVPGALVLAGGASLLTYMIWPLLTDPSSPKGKCEAIHLAEAEIATVLEDCVTVYFATPRATESAPPRSGAGHSDAPGVKFVKAFGEGLQWGRAEVSVPLRDEEIFANPSARIDYWTAFRDTKNRDRIRITEVVVGAAGTLGASSGYLKDFGAAIAAADNKVLFYIHGFNVPFEEGLKTAARLSLDLNLKTPDSGVPASLRLGQPFLFSWPNNEAVWRYLDDRDRNSLAASAYLAQAMSEIVRATGVRELNVIVHSMGNRVFIESLDEFARLQSGTSRNGVIIRVIHAAADVSHDDYNDRVQAFEDALAKASVVSAAVRSATIYSDRHDIALFASELVNFRARIGRPEAGRPNSPPFLYAADADARRFMTIDASGFESSLNHSAYTDKATILADVACALRDEKLSARPLGEVATAPRSWRIYSKRGSEACKVTPLPDYEPNCRRVKAWAGSWINVFGLLASDEDVYECSLDPCARKDNRPARCSYPSGPRAPIAEQPLVRTAMFKAGTASRLADPSGNDSAAGLPSQGEPLGLAAWLREHTADQKLKRLTIIGIQRPQNDSVDNLELAAQRAKAIRDEVIRANPAYADYIVIKTETTDAPPVRLGGTATEIGARIEVEVVRE